MHSDDYQSNDSHTRTARPDLDSDQALGDLLRTLPREQASFGFESRVLRKARQSPNPPLTFARGLRLAAPLAVAAVLGFVVGPSLFNDAEQQTGSTQMAESSATSTNDAARSPRQLPSVASGPVVNGQVVGGVNRGGVRPVVGPNPGYRPGASIERIRAEAARVRNELNQLRNERMAAGATVTVMMANGVEVQIDVRDLYEALQQRAKMMEQLERQAMEPNSSQYGGMEHGTADSDASPPSASPPPTNEPPLW